MSDRATKNGKALSLMIVSLLAIGGLLGVVLATAPPARADSCGQANSILSGTWTVSSAQVCSGIVFYLDGDLSVTGTGSLTLVNGGITFVEDTGHIHALTVAAGGSLILVNSTITTATNTLNPYVKLAASVAGTLAMRSQSTLMFPGTLALSSGAVLNMTASTITGFSDAQLSGLGNGAWVDDNDDSAVITMTGATAYLFQSTITKIYENTQAGGLAKNVTVGSTSSLYAYDSYIGVDFSNNWQVHNVMNVLTGSKAYFFNVTVDEVQSSATPQYQQLPAFVPDGTSTIYVLRWMHATATDPYGTTLTAATVWSHIGSQTAQYPDNGNGLVPSSRTLWYLSRTASNWNTTDSSGHAVIPLWTDTITSTSLPNAFTFSSYEVTTKYTTYLANGSAAFQPYPSIAASDNNLNVVVGVPVPGLTPDLSVASVTITGANGASTFQPLNTPITLSASIHDAGQNPVSNVVVLFFSTNVDTNGDGIMDSSVASYVAANFLIDNVTIPSVPANANATANASWTVRGSYETGMVFSVVVNPPLADPAGPSAIPETNLKNNIRLQQISLFTWPDLAFTGTSDISFPSEPVANNSVPVEVTVHNIGTGAATAATVSIYDGAALVSNVVTFNVNSGQVAHVEVTWHPTHTGYRNITFQLAAAANSMRNTDYNSTNDAIRITQIVASQPDLALLPSQYGPMTVTQNKAFTIVVHVYNLGQTAVQNTSVAVYINGNYSAPYGRTDGVAVATATNVSVVVSGIPTPGTKTMNIVVNPDHTLVEGGQGYSNNYANVTLTVQPPSGSIVLYGPSGGANFGPTDSVFVQGVVRDQTAQQNGIAGLNVTIAVLRSDNSVAQSITQTTDTNGLFSATLILNNLPDGQYTLRVSSAQGTITPYTQSLIVKSNVPFLNTQVPLLGIPWWLFLIIIAAVAAIVIGVTVYFKVYGLGKMVECGECGAFIPEDATTCPKCGVEFEKDMAKCSNCQAWIPVDVKQCPECGVEFATGEVEMADYQEKMRLQYDEVVQKFKEDASRQLGRALSDKEFQEWWRKQPTFLTFEDWLREEEEMRKMGSRPCPVCGTLNSVTATVCHKCGSLMKEQRPPSGGTGSGGMAPAVRQRTQAQGAPSGPPSGLPGGDQGGSQAAGGPDAIPRRVIRKPVTPAPVVQKKVIKRPMGEGEQAGTQDTDQQESGDQNQQGDEL
jgi:ribosomal protein L40E